MGPATEYFAGDLAGSSDDGAGRHWWRKLHAGDFTSHQLPETVGAYTRPPKW